MENKRELIKLKPLQWEYDDIFEEHIAMYYTLFQWDGLWKVIVGLYPSKGAFPNGYRYDTLEAAKAACQAHYEETIYDLLEVK